MVCLSRRYHFKFFKGCLPQILLAPSLNTLTQMHTDTTYVLTAAICITFLNEQSLMKKVYLTQQGLQCFCFFKNCSIAVITYLLIRFNKTRSILGNTKNADINGVKEQSTRIQHNISGLVRMKISDNPFFFKKEIVTSHFWEDQEKSNPTRFVKGREGSTIKPLILKLQKGFAPTFLCHCTLKVVSATFC